MKYIFTVLLSSCCFLLANAQVDVFEKVTKQYSLDVGYEHLSSKQTKYKSLSGLHIEFDYAWKLSGYNKKKNTYISVPLGYEILKSKEKEDIKILLYGWTVRHELAKTKKWIPFISYGLLLNQAWFDNLKGNDMGHETRFSVGINRKTRHRTKVSLAFNYSFLRIPNLGEEKAAKYSKVAVILGVRFGE